MSDLILKSIERTPFKWVELDMPKCALNYGTGLCSADLGVTGDQKCYNTRASCQDPSNYDGTDTLTLSFCDNRQYIPDDRYYFPYLKSVNITPASLNIGGGNSNKSAMGTMSTLSVTFSDHPHTDRLVDPYLVSRDFDPYERSTFWAKWRARNPFYLNKTIRYCSGYIDPDTGLVDPTTLITRTFFVTGFSGFSAGGDVTLRAADIFTLMANDKVKAPRVSKGKLAADISIGASSLTLTPAGIGDDEYPASGKVRVNNEVMSFTRSGDTLSLTRGVAGTESAEHELGDNVQICLEYSAQTPAAILESLLETYAAIDSVFLDKTQWASEVTDYIPRLYSTIITEPTGIKQLVSEMAEQMHFTPVWDDRVAKLSIKSVRPADGETITSLDDNRNLLQDSVTWTDEQDQLITDVWVYYGQKDPTKKLDETTNYAAVDVISAIEAKGAEQYDLEKIRPIYSRWISDGGAAIDLGQKLLERYSQVPRSVSFSLDAKDRELWLADFITALNRHNVGFTGLPESVPLQVISAQESVQGTTYSYTAQEYTGKTVTPTGELNLAISNDFVNLNLRDYYDANVGTSPQAGDKIRFTIRSGVTIGGCAFTDVTNISDSAATASDGSTVIDDLAGLSVFDGSYRLLTDLVRTAKMTKTQRAGIVTPAFFTPGQTYSNPRVGAYNQKLGNSVIEFPKAVSLRTGFWPSGVEIVIVNEGIICGEAPTSPVGYVDVNPSASWAFANPIVFGGDGGDAIEITDTNPANMVKISIDNKSIIFGAGGAGAPSAGVALSFDSWWAGGAISGGGGQGYDYGQHVVFLKDLVSTKSAEIETWPSKGSTIGSGSAGIFRLHSFNMRAASGNGGSAGENGGNELPETDMTPRNGRYGLAGDAISQGANLITWINKGTVIGAENN